MTTMATPTENDSFYKSGEFGNSPFSHLRANVGKQRSQTDVAVIDGNTFVSHVSHDYQYIIEVTFCCDTFQDSDWLMVLARLTALYRRGMLLMV